MVLVPPQRKYHAYSMLSLTFSVGMSLNKLLPVHFFVTAVVMLFKVFNLFLWHVFFKGNRNYYNKNRTGLMALHLSGTWAMVLLLQNSLQPKNIHFY